MIWLGWYTMVRSHMTFYCMLCSYSLQAEEKSTGSGEGEVKGDAMAEIAKMIVSV